MFREILMGNPSGAIKSTEVKRQGKNGRQIFPFVPSENYTKELNSSGTMQGRKEQAEDTGNNLLAEKLLQPNQSVRTIYHHRQTLCVTTLEY